MINNNYKNLISTRYYARNYIGYARVADLPLDFNELFSRFGFSYLVSPLHKPNNIHRHFHYVFYFRFDNKINGRLLMDNILVNYGFYSFFPCLSARTAFFHLLDVKTFNYFEYDKDDIKAIGGVDMQALWDRAFGEEINNG